MERRGSEQEKRAKTYWQLRIFMVVFLRSLIGIPLLLSKP